MRKMDKYLYMQIDESNTFFVDNTTTRFRVQLIFPLSLPGIWKVALTEFHAAEKSKTTPKSDECLYIYSDICKESIVYGEERPLLRRLVKHLDGKGITFSALLFMYQWKRMKCESLRSI